MTPLLLALALLQQPLDRRIAAAPDGIVRLTFAARPNVCGNGRGSVSMDCDDGNCGRYTVNVGNRDRSEVEYDCDPGPVRVSLHVSGGHVTSLRTYVGGRWRTATDGVTDLGTVGAREAAAYFLALVTKESGAGAENAVFPAILADSVTVWPDLLRIARDGRVSRDARRQTVFWLGQAAGEAATRGLTDLVDDRSTDRDVREQAVFALSQRPHDEGVPALIRIAKENPDPELRKKAIFWLGQSDDPRALALFEELLTKP
jgi:HEAT repeat protein